MAAEPANSTATTPRACPTCRGDTAIYHPYWRAFWDRCLPVQRAWIEAHPGENWFSSREYDELQQYVPPDHIPEESPCPTCDENGVGDLVTSGTADAAEALQRASRHLAAWRDNAGTDQTEARDAIDALLAVANTARDAAWRLDRELDYQQLSVALHESGPPLTEQYPPADEDEEP